MSDWPADPKSLIGWLFGGLMALVMWVWRKHETDTKESVAEARSRLEKLEETAVRKNEFAQLRADMDRRHDENTAKLDNIDAGVTATHQRIDGLYRDLVGRENR